MGGVDKLNELAAIMEKARQECCEKGKAAFTEAIGELFAAHPKLERFSWTQHTPYFNDGDACEFGVDEVRSITVDGSQYDDEPCYTAVSTWEGAVKEVATWPDDHKAAIIAVAEVHSALSSMEEAAELAFGDHVEVIVSRGSDGKPVVECEEYDHD